MFDQPTLAIMPSARVLRVHLLRHGETEQGSRRVCRGQEDVGLSLKGVEQSKRLAAFVRENEPTLSHVFSSDLSRCRVLAEQLKKPVVYTRELREQSMGSWEGKTWEELSVAQPAAVTEWWDNYVTACPEGGESYQEVFVRVLNWWSGAWQTLPDGANVAVVTHVGVIRALLSGWLGLGVGQSLRFAPGYATLATVLLADTGCVVERFGLSPPWPASPPP
jgi:probable phosphoglycerate mutase